MQVQTCEIFKNNFFSFSHSAIFICKVQNNHNNLLAIILVALAAEIFDIGRRKKMKIMSATDRNN
jgi:hypothetical protein